MVKITDYDLAIINTIKIIFLLLNIQILYFYLQRSINKKMHVLGLGIKYANNLNFNVNQEKLGPYHFFKHQNKRYMGGFKLMCFYS